MVSPLSQSPRILVVDDDPMSATLITRVLTRVGYHVDVAADGETALERLQSGSRADVVVLDRRLPGINGLEVLLTMKKTPGLRHIPVVMATAMDSQEEIWEGVRNGAFYYLLKPMDLDLLRRIVDAAVGEAQAKDRLWAEMGTLRPAIKLIHHGTFHYRTMRECEDLAPLLALACPEPQRSFVGLFELMLNALEHGNLGITYEEKSALIEARGWQDEVHRREALPENRQKRVTIRLSRFRTKVRFLLQDQGPGFQWQDFQAMDPARIFDSHGRGILLARWEAFDRVEYQGNGNRVLMEVG